MLQRVIISASLNNCENSLCPNFDLRASLNNCDNSLCSNFDLSDPVSRKFYTSTLDRSVPLKFHTKYLIHTLRDPNFLQC